MATLPPRKNPTPTKILKQHLTPLQTLVQLGFPKHRAEKALAATGHRGVQLASDWLVAHVRDPTVDTDNHRQYVLYACPTGELAEQLVRFWSESKELIWNGAHNYIPHITLVSFFKAPDESTEELVNTLETVINQMKLPDNIELETYISPNFMGLFVKQGDTEWLKHIAIRYTNKLSSLGISAEPQIKSLHLTLAYQFPSHLYQQLRLMVEKLTLTCPTNWELRLYSRDCRLQNAHVHKVTHAHMPREHDELELRVGDYIYIPEGACNISTDGWVEGTSWLTGISGHLPLNHTKRTTESDSWTLHTTIQITDNKNEILEKKDIPLNRKPPVLLSNDSVDSPDGVAATNEPIEASEALPTSSRQIFICRHGERVDFTFGAWIRYCFESNGSYVRRDLNMPKEIPTRNIQDFRNDSPLTTVGEVQASLVGDAMKSSSIKIDVAFTSPSLRCIQTLAHILKGLDLNIPMKIEPGLIEWLAWYPNGVPVWMTSEELLNAGFNIDKSYDPIIKAKELPLKENAAQYYERSFELIKRIIENTVGNILIVAHAASLAACTRQLTGGRVPPASEVTRLAQKVPYLACLTAREGLDGWQLHPPPFPPITHTSNTRFDWKVLL
ncbi:protein UBASH3A homolog isoform X2 [Ceratina calcarata]|uniref:Ecdysteroid-phosphate phosphatase n=1 Tax=Ceratina calcarata TaxID=156304 RepID=A0AAJ7JHD1_9HYME|nr:protein UBASH3A homolog isoform X2 [Ceratina calcarata]